jgi:hypothetical protein
MAISQNFPNTRPSLNLNFARSKTLDPRITFIRTQTGSEASYVDESGIIRYASADEPRFDHDPETGKCLGLMIEEQRTNLCYYGTTIQNFTVRDGGSSTGNATTAPDGTNTATRLQGSSSVVTYYDDNTARTYTSGKTYTFSCFFKANGTDQVFILLYGDKWINHDGTSNVLGKFNLTNGTVVAASSGSQRDPSGGAKIESYPNGWYRCSITETCSTTHTQIQQFIRFNGLSGDIYAWGYQIEEDKDMSSLIPTTTNATVTRNSDNVWMSDISDFFNPSQGTSVIKFSFRYDGVHNDAFRDLFAFRDHTTGVMMGVRGNNNNSQFLFTGYNLLFDDSDSNGSGDYSWLSPTTTRNLQHTVAVSYASTYFRMYRNDETSFSSINTNYGIGKAITDEYIPHINPSTGITTSNFTSLGFGNNGTTTTDGKINCNIESFAYYPSEVGVDNIKTFTRDQ